MTGTDDDDPLACVAAGDSRLRRGGRLKFFYGPMDCGKSTLALQMDYNHARQGRHGLVLTTIDRAGPGRLSTRIGLGKEAVDVAGLDLRALVRERWARGLRVDYLICDEASFYTVEQIEQLADLVDTSDVDVYAFGLATDFRTALFPAAQRLFELADEVTKVQVEVLCWCGRAGLLNARVVDGVIAREGDQVVIGDTTADGAAEPQPADVHYQVLCRRHHRTGDLGPAARAEGQLRLV
ncbi:thymidine kinase [Dactylosporangium matsuzakiense]|uniref:Thymidine kinase n=1 Tax=Dactylosporangium matsuzakiense TaxID=53360 RepID=A0A9W6KUN4_9ACTN|nr:thymidine kinase [Dactylosporangium matsuzakiense]